MFSSSHAPTLLTNVVMPALMYSDEDAQMWLEDPQEYVSKLSTLSQWLVHGIFVPFFFCFPIVLYAWHTGANLL